MEIRNHPLVRKFDDIKFLIGIIIFFLAILYYAFLPEKNEKILKLEQENTSIELPDLINKTLDSKNLTKITIKSLTHEKINKIRIELKFELTVIISIPRLIDIFDLCLTHSLLKNY